MPAESEMVLGCLFSLGMLRDHPGITVVFPRRSRPGEKHHHQQSLLSPPSSPSPSSSHHHQGSPIIITVVITFLTAPPASPPPHTQPPPLPSPLFFLPGHEMGNCLPGLSHQSAAKYWGPVGGAPPPFSVPPSPPHLATSREARYGDPR